MNSMQLIWKAKWKSTFLFMQKLLHLVAVRSCNSTKDFGCWSVSFSHPHWSLHLMPDAPSVNYIESSGLLTQNYPEIWTVLSYTWCFWLVPLHALWLTQLKSNKSIFILCIWNIVSNIATFWMLIYSMSIQLKREKECYFVINIILATWNKE